MQQQGRSTATAPTTVATLSNGLHVPLEKEVEEERELFNQLLQLYMKKIDIKL